MKNKNLILISFATFLTFIALGQLGYWQTHCLFLMCAAYFALGYFFCSEQQTIAWQKVLFCLLPWILITPIALFTDDYGADYTIVCITVILFLGIFLNNIDNKTYRIMYVLSAILLFIFVAYIGLTNWLQWVYPDMAPL